MEWSPAAVDAWMVLRRAESKDGIVHMGHAMLALLRETQPSSALRAALHDRYVWANPQDAIYGRALLNVSGFSMYDFPAAIEQAAAKDAARRVGERYLAMALASYGQTSFDSFGVQVVKVVERVRALELGPGFQPSEIAGRWHGLIDTSVVIEYRDIDDIDWIAETRQKAVTIWISPVLLDELDDMKFRSRDDRVKRRAELFTRWVSPLLAKAVTPGGAQMPKHPTVVVRAWAPSLDLTAPDSRHLEAAFALLDRHVPVRLITGDSGQKLRALAHGIEVFDLDNDLRLRPDEPVDTSSQP